MAPAPPSIAHPPRSARGGDASLLSCLPARKCASEHCPYPRTCWRGSRLKMLFSPVPIGRPYPTELCFDQRRVRPREEALDSKGVEEGQAIHSQSVSEVAQRLSPLPPGVELLQPGNCAVR